MKYAKNAESATIWKRVGGWQRENHPPREPPQEERAERTEVIINR